MPFQKDNRLSKGRPKGSPNKYTVEVKDKLQFILDEILNSIDIEELDIEHKLRFIQIASQYTIPKLKHITEEKPDPFWGQEHSIMIYTHKDPETGEWVKREEKLGLKRNPINWVQASPPDGCPQEKFDEIMG